MGRPRRPGRAAELVRALLPREPITYEERFDYANPEAEIANSRTVVWLHTLHDILGALRAAGLRLDRLHEHPRLASQLFPGLVRDADGMWTWLDKPWLPPGLGLLAAKARGA